MHHPQSAVPSLPPGGRNQIFYQSVCLYYFHRQNSNISLSVSLPCIIDHSELVNIHYNHKQKSFKHQIQEAQLPQRDSASATHVFLASLTDRALHWAPHLFYSCDECHKAHSILLHSCCVTWIFIIELCAKVQISIGNYPIKLTG